MLAPLFTDGHFRISAIRDVCGDRSGVLIATGNREKSIMCMKDWMETDMVVFTEARHQEISGFQKTLLRCLCAKNTFSGNFQQPFQEILLQPITSISKADICFEDIAKHRVRSYCMSNPDGRSVFDTIDLHVLHLDMPRSHRCFPKSLGVHILLPGKSLWNFVCWIQSPSG